MPPGNDPGTAPGSRISGMSAGGRKSYQAPQLSFYGDVSRITQAVGNTGSTDGAKGNPHKTRL
jgi:hypothetical protein